MSKSKNKLLIINLHVLMPVTLYNFCPCLQNWLEYFPTAPVAENIIILQNNSCLVSSVEILHREDSKYCFHFRMENIINDLKERSGKSLKVKVEDLREVVVGTAVYFVLFLTCAMGKFVIVMNAEKKDKLKISAGKSYFVKNFRHVSSISSVPIFLSSNSSVFRASHRASDSTNASFNEEEISLILDQLDIGNLFDNPAENNVPQQSSQSSGGTVVSLPDFIKNPSAINEQHWVEVSELISLSLYCI